MSLSLERTRRQPLVEARSPVSAADKPARRARLIRTTAFKLTLVYLAVFAALSLGLIYYISSTTAGLIDDRLSVQIDGEITELTARFRRTNLFRLIDTIQDRSMRPDASVYLITDFSGNPIAGNVAELIYDPGEMESGAAFPVYYRRLADAGEAHNHRALAKLAVLGGGYRLLVGRDVEDRIEFATIIRRSIRGAIIVVVALALISWLFLSRSVLRKVDAVAASSRSIVAGDLTRRLPTDRSGDEFDRLAASVNAMLDEIERLHGGLQEVSQNIAHDLKTPLTRVRNRLDEMSRVPPPADRLQDVLAAVIEECDSLMRTFNALLTIARVESHVDGAPLEDVDLSALVADMADLYGPAAEDEGLSLSLRVAPNVHACGEPTLLRTLVANLLDNAMKYGASQHGDIEVRLEADGESVRLSVRDHGPGVPAADVARLTDRFVRVDQARSKPGAGLGLSMVHAIALHHGGTLHLENADPGFRATVSLPRVR